MIRIYKWKGKWVKVYDDCRDWVNLREINGMYEMEER